MKNWLSYYYNMNIDEIHQKDKNYFFEIKQFKYIFFPYSNEINKIKDIYKLSENLLNNGIYCHRIILNKDNNYFTLIDGTPFVLMKYYPNLDKKIQIGDIINFQNIKILNNKKKNSWKQLWERKIDYFEYQLNQFGKSHPLVLESFGYFSGYAETAVSMLNEAKFDDNNLVLSHRRLSEDSTLFDLYNPFNLIIDYRVRDICEFYKNQIFQKKNILSEIVNSLSYFSFSSEEYLIFFIRMLYPSTYFDYFEKIMNNEIDEENLKTIIDNIDDYEYVIKNLYLTLLPYLPQIEWLR